MEKSIVYLTLSVGGIYLVLDEFYGKKRISQFVSQVVPSVSSSNGAMGVVNNVMNGKGLDEQIVDNVTKTGKKKVDNVGKDFSNDPLGTTVNIINSTPPFRYLNPDGVKKIYSKDEIKNMSGKEKTISLYGQGYYDVYGVAKQFR